jgi:hypothetical protein
MERPAHFFVATLVGAMLVVAPARGGAQNPPNVPSVRTVDGDALLRITGRVLLDTIAVWNDVPGTNAQVFTRVKQMLDSLKIPYSRVDSAGGLITNESFVARRLAGRNNSTWLRCGFGPSGEYANVWRVNASYAMYFHPPTAGTGTRLGIALMGWAKDMSGTASTPLYCASTGALENSIARQIVAESRR